MLRAGEHRLTSTLIIGAEHVNLTIMAFPGEQPWITGAVELSGLAWSKVSLPAKYNDFDIVSIRFSPLACGSTKHV